MKNPPTTKKIIKKSLKAAKKHPTWFTKEEIQYIQLMKKVIKKD